MSEPCIIVQARMGGERFPGKVLAPFHGEPMLYRQLQRLQMTKLPIGVACPNTPGNQVIKLWCAAWHMRCQLYDLPEANVVARYWQAARIWDCDPIIRVTADCPLIDPEVILALVAQWKETPSLDHLGLDGRWPDGTDVEIVSRYALQAAYMHATIPSDLEHVTPYIWRQPHAFRCATMPCPEDCTWQQYSVDTPDDLVLAQRLAEQAQGRGGVYYGWREIDHVLRDQPDLRAQHEKRPLRNHRYTQQVAEEDGLDQVPTWHALRYQHGGP